MGPNTASEGTARSISDMKQRWPSGNGKKSNAVDKSEKLPELSRLDWRVVSQI